jgi:hypothetical protein
LETQNPFYAMPALVSFDAAGQSRNRLFSSL